METELVPSTIQDLDCGMFPATEPPDLLKEIVACSDLDGKLPEIAHPFLDEFIEKNKSAIIAVP